MGASSARSRLRPLRRRRGDQCQQRPPRPGWRYDAGRARVGQAVVPQSVFRDGASVLNADNEWTVRMAETARGEIIFFSMDEENPVIRDHRRERGRAVVLRQTRAGEMLTLLETKRRRACSWHLKSRPLWVVASVPTSPTLSPPRPSPLLATCSSNHPRCAARVHDRLRADAGSFQSARRHRTAGRHGLRS